MRSVASFSGWVEIRPGFTPRPQISHVVFDFDGTLSWLRHGWPGIMCDLFESYWPAREGEPREDVSELLLDEILSLNGKASIHQMIRCAELVRERGGEAPEPEALLWEYQRRLDLVILERTELIRGAQAQRDDFVVWGARGFVERLQERGLTLIILSGTIEARVKEEAALLDLARYFGEHVYGGTADAAQSSKRAVMSRLLGEEQITGEHLVAFGDGPVEIQVAKELGGLAVAVASDEGQNGSGKVDLHKYKQLAAAGADIVIPDYRDGDALLERLIAVSAG
jgi:phosphoglycolate phosphatase-like HAD superfamily hydrolase